MKCIQLFCLLLCLGGTISVFAQKRNLIIYKDTITGKDTVVANVSFANEKYKKRQYAVCTINKEGNITHTYQAKDITAYKEGNTLFISQRILVNGDIRQVLLPRVYWKNDLSIYSFIPDKGREEYYVQMSKDSLLLPLKGSPETNGANPLTAYLEQYPVAQEEIVKKYISTMKPTPESFDSRYLVCRTGNTNYIPRIRWGVLAGGGIVKLTYDPYDFESKLQGFVGLFADFPIVEGLSAHPELTFQKYALTYNKSIPETDVVYNRTNLGIPLLLRYTVISMKSRFLPYIQIGTEWRISTKNELLGQEKKSIGDGFVEWMPIGPTSLSKSNWAFVGGLGMEWKLTPKHSCFIDLRYHREISDDFLSGCCVTISYNL